MLSGLSNSGYDILADFFLVADELRNKIVDCQRSLHVDLKPWFRVIGSITQLAYRTLRHNVKRQTHTNPIPLSKPSHLPSIESGTRVRTIQSNEYAYMVDLNGDTTASITARTRLIKQT